MFTPLLVASLALSAPVPKASAPELKWKFAKGDTVYVKWQQEAESKTNGAGSGSASELVMQLTVTAAGPKETTLEMEVLGMKTGAGAGGAVKLADVAGVVGKKVTLTLDGEHKVTKTDGAEGLAKAGGAGSMLEEGYLRSMFDDLFRAVPGKALGKGETWTGESEGELTAGLTAKRAFRGTVGETADGLTKLEAEFDQTWGGTAGGNGAAFTMELRGEKGKRAVLFDPKAGRVRKVEDSIAMSGTIGVGGGGGGGGQNITLSAEMKFTLTVTDDKPKDEK